MPQTQKIRGFSKNMENPLVFFRFIMKHKFERMCNPRL